MPVRRVRKPRGVWERLRGLDPRLGAVALAVLATLAAAMQVMGSAGAATARRALDAGDAQQALSAAQSSLAWYRWNPQALHTANVVRKRQGRPEDWRAIAEDCAAARAWDEDAVTLDRLEAEARWQLGESQAASEAAWAALALEPVPRRSPSQFWRLALLGAKPQDARRNAAAWFTLETLDLDAETPDTVKRVTRAEVEKAMKGQR